MTIEPEVFIDVQVGRKGGNLYRSHSFKLSYIVAKALLSGNKVKIEIGGYDGENILEFKAEGSIKNETL